MSIVKYKTNNGKYAVYESTSFYDPDKKQARPKRKYLGMEDPKTGELIPSSGKRGRPKKDTETNRTDIIDQFGATQDTAYEKIEKENRRLLTEIGSLRSDQKTLQKKYDRCIKAVNAFIDEWNLLFR